MSETHRCCTCCTPVVVNNNAGGGITVEQLNSAIAAAIAPLVTAIAEQGTKFMATIKDLTDKFVEYVQDRDEADVAKDAASAAKDATIADLTAQLAALATQHGADVAAVAALQQGIDDATAKEQAEIDKIKPPTPPVDVPPVDTGGTPAGDGSGAPAGDGTTPADGSETPTT